MCSTCIQTFPFVWIFDILIPIMVVYSPTGVLPSTGELQFEGQYTNKTTCMEGNRCPIDRHKNKIIIDEYRLIDSPAEPIWFLLLVTKEPKTDDHWWVTGVWTCCRGGGGGAVRTLPIFPSCLLLDKKDNRGPEAKLKLLDALIFPPFIFRAFLTVKSQNSYNRFVFCLCSKNLATK